MPPVVLVVVRVQGEARVLGVWVVASHVDSLLQARSLHVIRFGFERWTCACV